MINASNGGRYAGDVIVIFIAKLLKMVFQEQDINFDRIDWREFEELCFDLLMKYQYHDMIWHQGSADAGRDIEALATVVNPLLGTYVEKWFFECKFYSSGVPMVELVSKIAWAEANRVKHFVLMTNTHPTKDAWDFLKLKQQIVNFKIHVIDGKLIKSKLLAFPDIIVKYFADDTVVWVKNLVRQWVFQDALPDIKTLSKLREVVEPSKLGKEDLVFILFAFQQSDYDEDLLPYDIEPFDFEFIWTEVSKHANTSYPIDLTEDFGSDEDWGRIISMSNEIEQLDKFVYVAQSHNDADKQNVQILLKRYARQITVKIANGNDTMENL